MAHSLENFGVHKGITVYKSNSADMSIFLENFGGLAPNNSIGKDGDRAIDLSTICLFEKIDGVWIELGCLNNFPPPVAVAKFKTILNSNTLDGPGIVWNGSPDFNAVVTHGLNTTDVIVQVFGVSSGETILVTTTRIDPNTVVIDCINNPTEDYRILILAV